MTLRGWKGLGVPYLFYTATKWPKPLARANTDEIHITPIRSTPWCLCLCFMVVDAGQHVGVLVWEDWMKALWHLVGAPSCPRLNQPPNAASCVWLQLGRPRFCAAVCNGGSSACLWSTCFQAQQLACSPMRWEPVQQPRSDGGTLSPLMPGNLGDVVAHGPGSNTGYGLRRMRCSF
jgi:hypothetical protein